jgi:hypothetical protein
MGKRDPRIGSRRDSGGHAWHHLPWNPRLDQRKRFLGTASKDEGISALESNYDLPQTCILDKELTDIRLLQDVVSGALSHVDHERAVFGMPQHLPVHKAID